ncbi:ester cyclase [Streptomyces rishiriensis]|uniref:Ester cyclase n=1 Tax=Streptomyces rishiriensis TaxID=68264 RepID=A0ABU0NHI0_STRRH|nr:ester cyclase [Streptomyces rishiriensis]MDQ0578568.1 putative ester cyclase [Streptomyces rishiriensis]
MNTSENILVKNKETVRAFIDALFTKGDLGAIDDYLAADFVDHDPPLNGPPDRTGMRSAGALFREACPDWHSEPYLMIAEGDLVVECFTAAGTQRGDLFGAPAPAEGRTVVLRGINVFRVQGERIVERWGRLDELGVLEQLGIVPAPA